MTKDRLPSLIAARRLRVEEDPFEDRERELERGFGALDFGYSLMMECEDLEIFLQEADEVRILIQRIRHLVADIKKKHSSILSAPKMDEGIRQDIERLSSEIKEIGNKVRSKLKRFEKELNLDKNKSSPAEVRIRKNQQAALSRAFVDIMTDYNKAQVEHRERCKRRFQRQLEITGRKTTDDELEEMLEKGTPIRLFTQDIKFDDVEQARQTLADIEARHDDIVKLERSIVELHSMFMDMAMLVDTQGELINRIETNVMASTDYIESAKKSTRKALVYQSKARRKLMILVGIAVLLIVVIVGAVAGSLARKR